MVIAHFIKLQQNYGTIFPYILKLVEQYPNLSLLSRYTYSKLLLMIKFNCCYLGLMLVYIVIVWIVFLVLRDFGGRRFISTVLFLLLSSPIIGSFVALLFVNSTCIATFFAGFQKLKACPLSLWKLPPASPVQFGCRNNKIVK